MRIVDCHVHQRREADPKSVLQGMDANGVDRMLVISPAERRSIKATRQNLLVTKKLFDEAPDRISGLARVEPTIPGITGLVAEALCEMGYVGVKVLPDHWYAYEERLEPFWEKMNELKASILIHAGILYGNDDSSRFCRPVYLEKLQHYLNIRFVMAHMGWPWCEECVAVMGRMRAAAAGTDRESQARVDLTPGGFRDEDIVRMIEYPGAGPERIMFGTDESVPGDFTRQKGIIERHLAVLDRAGLDEKQKERIMSGTADELFPQRV